ncbi:MAG: ABC transporter permease [Gemmatimonadaceae bacterium]
MPETPAVAAFAIPESRDATLRLASGAFADAFRRVLGYGAARAAILFLVVLIALALLAPWIAPYDPNATHGIVALKLQAPTLQHPFGTDAESRDVLSRMLHGARVSLSVAVLAALLAAGVGLIYGATSGYAGGIVDDVMMRIVDASLALPRVLLLLLVFALWREVSVFSLVVILGLTGWFPVSRLARAEALALSSRDFVVAARALGAGHWRILVRHVLPHAAGPVVVAATVAVAQVILIEAGLSFLGYGIPQPNPTWGNIIRDGREWIATAWWLTVFPGLALVGTALALNTLADRLRAALNPRQLHAP